MRAVLDWEMSTLGDPLTDLALFLLYYRLRRPGHRRAGRGRRRTTPTAELAARYAEGTGLDTSRLGWYVGLACFKLAVISEGIHFRFTQGQTVGEGFDEIGEHVAPLVTHGLQALESLEG